MRKVVPINPQVIKTLRSTDDVIELLEFNLDVLRMLASDYTVEPRDRVRACAEINKVLLHLSSLYALRSSSEDDADQSEGFQSILKKMLD